MKTSVDAMLEEAGTFALTVAGRLARSGSMPLASPVTTIGAVVYAQSTGAEVFAPTEFVAVAVNQHGPSEVVAGLRSSTVSQPSAYDTTCVAVTAHPAMVLSLPMQKLTSDDVSFARTVDRRVLETVIGLPDVTDVTVEFSFFLSGSAASVVNDSIAPSVVPMLFVADARN